MSAPSSLQTFLSYSRNDLAAAEELRELLRTAGIEVFKDDASIRAGDRWFDRLEAAVSQCASFVPVLLDAVGPDVLPPSCRCSRPSAGRRGMPLAARPLHERDAGRHSGHLSPATDLGR